MNIAAVLVSTKPEQITSLREAINANPWSEVHYIEPTGRMVITIEGSSSEEDVGRLKEIKALPEVLSAEMVEYCFEDESEEMWKTVHEEAQTIPPYLSDSKIEQKGGISYQKMKRLSNF